MKPPAERLVDELRRVATDWQRGSYVSSATYTLDELLEAAADRLEALEALERARQEGHWWPNRD
jgi:hypothetical protein